MSHELIKREYAYRGRILDLSRSRFVSEAKGEVEIEIVHHNGGAGTLPLFEDGTVALVKQWRYPLGRYSLEIAAGRIERGHTPEETAKRELEEVAAKIGDSDVQEFVVTFGRIIDTALRYERPVTF